MGIFLVTPISDPDKLAAKIAEMLPSDHYPIARTNSILVSYSGTTKELSDLLGVTNNDSGSAVIVSIANYYGRAPTDVWEWMQTRMERD